MICSLYYYTQTASETSQTVKNSLQLQELVSVSSTIINVQMSDVCVAADWTRVDPPEAADRKESTARYFLLYFISFCRASLSVSTLRQSFSDEYLRCFVGNKAEPRSWTFQVLTGSGEAAGLQAFLPLRRGVSSDRIMCARCSSECSSCCFTGSSLWHLNR